jgi:hypothetical protein
VRFVRLIIVALIAMFGGLFFVPPATYAYDVVEQASPGDYDVAPLARVDRRQIEAIAARPNVLGGAREGSASSVVAGSGMCTTPLPLSSATNTVDDALAYATRAEKLDHIFVPRHNLDPLVQQLGSREAVVQQMLNSVKGLTPASGTFEIPVTIGGQSVVVRGAVVNGVTKIGTAFTP